MTLVLRGAAVVTSLDPVAVVTGDIVVDGGRVVSVGATPDRLPPDTNHLDVSGSLVIPGNVCAHTHLYSALARGMPYDLAPPRTFLEILRRIWWRLDRALDPASIRASAMVGGMEALLAGTTTVIDHHASPGAIDGSLDIVADALATVGIRSVLAYEVTDRDGPELAAAGVRENRRFAARTAAGEWPLAASMIGAHASFTLSEATLAACAEAADAAGTGLHIHVAEDAADQDDCRARFGVGVAERLRRAGALTARTVLAHAIHLDEVEAAIVDESGATVVHNARSNMNNGVGHAPLARLGGRVALGTDGIGADMFEESRAAYLRAREDDAARDRGIAADPSWALGRLAESARLAGRLLGEPLLGRIEPGAPADLVVIEHGLPTPLDANTLPAHWIFGLGSRLVRDVVVAGDVVVRDRRLELVGQDWLARSAREQAARLWARLESISEHPFDPRAAAVR
jgi:putative selenium metabolism protein SsnA